MQIAALVCMALFYGCYFTKMISQSRQGIQTDQMGKNTKGFVKGIEITLKLSTALIVPLELFAICRGTSLLPAWAGYIGIFFAAAGVVFFTLSVLEMKDSWRAGVPQADKTEFISGGVFQISRNPAFLGFDLLHLGILLMFFSVWLFAVSLFVSLMFHLQIVNVEEPFLQERFGETYLTYRKKVCRYLGRK